MTESRYELEFQATRDGVTWVPYRFKFKPQDLNEAPGIYAPYQPRFEWNLWFSSLGWARRTSGSSRPSFRLMQRSTAERLAQGSVHGEDPRAVDGRNAPEHIGLSKRRIMRCAVLRVVSMHRAHPTPSRHGPRQVNAGRRWTPQRARVHAGLLEEITA